jgi:hypothetical protein
MSIKKKSIVMLSLATLLLASSMCEFSFLPTARKAEAGFNPVCLMLSSCGLSPCTAPGALCWAGYIDDCHCGEYFALPYPAWVCACR